MTASRSSDDAYTRTHWVVQVIRGSRGGDAHWRTGSKFTVAVVNQLSESFDRKGFGHMNIGDRGQTTKGFRSFDVMNSYDDGASLDIFVDWFIDAGHQVQRIGDYHELTRFETALKGLLEKLRQLSVLLPHTR
jgi:thioester reductase-like protein